MKSILDLVDTLDDPDKTAEDKIRILKLHRCRLLNEIHEKQQLLDQIDYLIVNISR